MPLRKQEKFCCVEFNRWIRKRLPSAEISWKQESKDPPDFWMTLNGRKYAVEVTRVLSEQERAGNAAVWREVKRAETEAREAAELRGTYVVIFDQGVDGLRKVRNVLRAEIRHFVRETAVLKKSPLMPIEVHGHVFCTIRKLSARGSKLVAVGGVISSGSSEGEISQELTELLQLRLAAKCAIPTKLKVPTILILYDLYALASRRAFINCLRAIPEAKQFHTVYVVEDIGRGYIAQQGRWPAQRRT